MPTKEEQLTKALQELKKENKDLTTQLKDTQKDLFKAMI